jgi:polyhydroxyalkanoate synthesis repressor PhaR
MTAPNESNPPTKPGDPEAEGGATPAQSPKPAPDPAPAAAAASEEPKPRRVIKRYSNRKLYDTVSSKYVTLEEIAHMIKAGEEIAIIDNKTKDDLTAVTLTQIIYEEEKRKSRMPLAMLRQLITSSNDAIQEFFERSKDQANRGVTEFRQGAISLKDVASRGVSGITDTARRVFQRGEADVERRVEETLKGFEESFDQIKSKLEGHARSAEHESARVLTRVVERLEQRSQEIDRMIADLKAFARSHQSEPPPPPPANPEEG